MAISVRSLDWPKTLLALLLPVTLIPTTFSATTGIANGAPESANALAPVAVAALMATIQIRHGLAGLRGERPRGWPLTLAALTILAYTPSLLLHWWNWQGTALLVLTSILILLRGRTRVVAFTATCLSFPAHEVYVALVAGDVYGWDVDLGYWIIYWVNVWILPFVQYTVVLLARRLDALNAARAEQADQAVRIERLRLSRELHDLLGQSFTAISTRGELVRRQIPTAIADVRQHILSIEDIARRTMHSMRKVAHAGRNTSLVAELAQAQQLLKDASVNHHIDVDSAGPEPAAQYVLAAAVREGVTNIVRHSAARTATITLSQTNGAIDLEIVNDGVQSTSPWGVGLTGLAQRAEECGGTLKAAIDKDDTFRLHLRVAVA